MSDTRRKSRPRRAEVRAQVLARDVRCRCDGRRTPVLCPGWATEVHELGRGQWRRFTELEPDACVGLSSVCHRWVTLNPGPAIEVGLAWDAGVTFRWLNDRGLLKSVNVKGML